MKIELYSDQQKDKISTSSLGTSDKDIFEKIKPIKPKISELKEEYNALKDDFIRNMLNKPNLLQQDGVKLFSFIEKQNVLLNQINSVFKNYSYNSNKSDDNFITPNTSTNNTNNAKTNEIYNSNTSLQTDSKKLELDDSFVLQNKVLEYKEKLDHKDSLIVNLNNEISVLKEKLNYRIKNNNNVCSQANLDSNANKDRTVTFGDSEYDPNSNVIGSLSQSPFETKFYNHNNNFNNNDNAANIFILQREKDLQSFNNNYEYKIENNYFQSKSEKNSPSEGMDNKNMQMNSVNKLDQRCLEYANFNEVNYEKVEQNFNQSSKSNGKQYNDMPLKLNENRAIKPTEIPNNPITYSLSSDQSSNKDPNKTYSLNPSDNLKNLNLNLLGEDYKTVNPHLISSSPIHQDWDEIHKVLNKFDNNKYLENQISPYLSSHDNQTPTNSNPKPSNSPMPMNLLNLDPKKLNSNEYKNSENSYAQLEKKNSNEEKFNSLSYLSSKPINNFHDKGKFTNNKNIHSNTTHCQLDILESNTTHHLEYFNHSLDENKIFNLENFNNSALDVEKLSASIDHKVDTYTDRRNDESFNLRASLKSINTISHSHSSSYLKSIPIKSNNSSNNSNVNNNINGNRELKKLDSSKSLKSNGLRGKVAIGSNSLTLLDVRTDMQKDNIEVNSNHKSSFLGENSNQNLNSLPNNSSNFSANNLIANVNIMSNETPVVNSKKRQTGNLQLGYSNLKNAAENSKIKKTQNNKVLIKTDKSLNNSVSNINSDDSMIASKSLNNSFRGNINNNSSYLLNNSMKAQGKLSSNNLENNRNLNNNSNSNNNLKMNSNSVASLHPTKATLPNPGNNKTNLRNMNKCNSEEEMISNSKRKDHSSDDFISNSRLKNTFHLGENTNSNADMVKYNVLPIQEINNSGNKAEGVNKGSIYYLNIKDNENSKENYYNNHNYPDTKEESEEGKENIYIQDNDDYQNENDFSEQDSLNYNQTSNFRNYTGNGKSNNSSFFTQKQLNFLNSNFDKIREETEEYAEEVSGSNSAESGDLNVDDFKYDYETYEKNLIVNASAQTNFYNVGNINNISSAVNANNYTSGQNLNKNTANYSLNNSAGKSNSFSRANSNPTLGSNTKNKKN